MKLSIIIFSLFSVAAYGDKRVISLSPAITEIIFELKLNEFLVGTSEFSDYPDEAKNLPHVGPYSKPLLEKIISLRPDLVFIPTEGPEDIEIRLRKQNIPFVIL